MKEKDKNQLQTLYTAEQIQTRVQEIAKVLSEDLAGKRVVAVAVMKGSFRFYCDLLLNMSIDVICDFCACSSYGLRDKPSTEIRLQLDIQSDVQDKHVILIEDIIDRGITVHTILEHIKARKPKSITVVSLLQKQDQLIEKDLKIDHVGFIVKDDPFIVGYGLDYQEKYRQLSYIATISNS